MTFVDMVFEYFIFRRIADQRARSISAFIVKVSTAATALSIAVMVLSSALIDGFQQEVKNKVFDFWAHFHIKPYTLTQSFNEHPMSADTALIHSLRKNLAVDEVQSVVYKTGLLKTDHNVEGIVLRGVGADFSKKRMRNFLVEGDLIATEMPPDTLSNLYEINLSASTAQRMKLRLHDKVLIAFMDKEIKLRKFIVKGIYKTGIETFDKQFAIVPMSCLQKLNKWTSDSISGLEVYIKNPNKIDEVAPVLKESITNPDVEVLSIKEIRPDIFDWLNLQRTNELIILTMMFIVAIINMSTGLLILILERTNMIGILKSLGARNVSLGKIFLLQAMFITLKGVVYGLLVGLGICFIQDQFHLIKLDEASYYVSYAPISLNTVKICFIALGTILLSTILMVVPAYLVTKISPVKVIEFK